MKLLLTPWKLLMGEQSCLIQILYRASEIQLCHLWKAKFLASSKPQIKKTWQEALSAEGWDRVDGQSHDILDV